MPRQPSENSEHSDEQLKTDFPRQGNASTYSRIDLKAVACGKWKLNVTKNFALKGQDGGNRGQRRRCARGERYPHNNATLKRVA